MNTDEKTLARHLFHNRIYKADGQAFEDLFTQIMNYAEPGFQQVKPQGSLGDRKNDGYIAELGRYYQVYAPEKPEASLSDAIKKLKNDFTELRASWSPVKEYIFVFNDKYQGAYASLIDAVAAIKADHDLRATGIMAAKDLENALFNLSDDQILSVVGFLSASPIAGRLNFGILGEIIEHIMKRPLPSPLNGGLNAPEWDEKIRFNGLSATIENYLDQGFYQVGDLDEYLNNNSDFLKQELRDRVFAFYRTTIVAPEFSGADNADMAFVDIWEKLCPRQESQYQRAALVIMAKYFASCDIFEDPSPC